MINIANAQGRCQECGEYVFGPSFTCDTCIPEAERVENAADLHAAYLDSLIIDQAERFDDWPEDFYL